MQRAEAEELALTARFHATGGPDLPAALPARRRYFCWALRSRLSRFSA